MSERIQVASTPNSLGAVERTMEALGVRGLLVQVSPIALRCATVRRKVDRHSFI
jgi:hypothetical protein